MKKKSDLRIMKALEGKLGIGGRIKKTQKK